MTLLLWFRRDLRLADHPALHEAAASGRPVIPVFLRDEAVEALGVAPRMRIGMAAAALAESLAGIGSRLVFRAGPAAATLAALAAETGAQEVWFTGLHDPLARRLEAEVAERMPARRFPGRLLHDPAMLRTGTGNPYRVFAPFRTALMRSDPGDPLPPPARLAAPEAWPATDALADWHLDAPMNRGGPVVAAWQRPGEAGAAERLAAFIETNLNAYATRRDPPAADGSSRLAENLSYGEISPRTLWAAGRAVMERGSTGAEAFLREVAWRDFATHLLWHDPSLVERPWKRAFDGFGYAGDGPLVEAWRRGMTGFPLVDAGMREMWVTGRMHNRVRMVVASLLTKHLMADWRLGADFFADSLTDWDAASNAVNWQWVAGSGPDAAPFFRILSPLAQARDWDGEGAYVRRWIAEGQRDPPATALAFFDAVPRSWDLSPRDLYPAPIIDLKAAREAALAAFRSRIRDAASPDRDGARTGS